MRAVDLLAVVMTWAGGAALLIGLASIAKPVSFLHVRTRAAGAAVAGAGLLAVAAATMIGGRLTRPATGGARLDEFSPEYHFHEVHSIRVHAPKERVYAAIKAVTADEIRFFRTLTWIRSPSLARRAESIMAPSRQTPIHEVATRTTFVLLADDPGRELVTGTVIGRPWTHGRRPEPRDFIEWDRPGYCKAAMNFQIEDEGGGWARLSTETRVFATSEEARRNFALYWRVIYPGSALIRREWLKAIQRRAEGP
jgi:hypothetical protein